MVLHTGESKKDTMTFFIKHRKTILVSIMTNLILLIAGGGALFVFKDDLFGYFNREYVRSERRISAFDTSIIPASVSVEDQIVSAVEKANRFRSPSTDKRVRKKGK